MSKLIPVTAVVENILDLILGVVIERATQSMTGGVNAALAEMQRYIEFELRTDFDGEKARLLTPLFVAMRNSFNPISTRFFTEMQVGYLGSDREPRRLELVDAIELKMRDFILKQNKKRRRVVLVSGDGTLLDERSVRVPLR